MKPWVVKELTRRAGEYGMNPNLEGGKPFSGPRAAWTRVFSNGISTRPGADKLDGFMLGGTFDFNNSYGFNDEKKSVIGVDAYGRPHKLDQNGATVVQQGDFPHRPPPSVTSVESELFGSQNASFPSLCRKVKVNWRCFSLAQLNYLIPYFLTPRITLLVEWGWSNYDELALVDLTDTKWIASMFTDPSYTSEFVEFTNGNYDAATGFITDYGYSLNSMGGYDCFTTITNTNFLIEGQSLHNQSIISYEDGTGKEKVKKGIVEFFNDDLINLGNIGSAKMLADLGISPLNLRHKIFDASAEKNESNANQEGMKWIRLDLVVDILNAFSSVVMVDGNGKPVSSTESGEGGEGEDKPVRLNNLTIADIKISAHPALKSVNKDVLFPNSFAPRLCMKATGKPNTGENDIQKQTFSNVPYATLFEAVGKIISQDEMDSSYDDLKSIINPQGNSFPIFKDDTDAKLGKLQAGYWGYLSDVFVSVEMLKNLVNENDTTLKLLESLLQKISQAMCNIAQLKLVVTTSNKYYSVGDSNLSAINNPNDASKLMRLSIGDATGTIIRSAGFDVKIAPEMMNQLVAQSATEGTSTSSTLGIMSNDPKKTQPNRYSRGDRLFNYGALPYTIDSNQSSDTSSTSEKNDAKLKRMFTKDSPSFYIYTAGKGKDAKHYILAETDPQYMTQVMTGIPDSKATYSNNAIMPGITFNMEILGISGITYLSQFTLDHVPEPYYYGNAVWQISDIKHRIENKVWTTTITAQVRPLTTV